MWQTFSIPRERRRMGLSRTGPSILLQCANQRSRYISLRVDRSQEWGQGKIPFHRNQEWEKTSFSSSTFFQLPFPSSLLACFLQRLVSLWPLFTISVSVHIIRLEWIACALWVPECQVPSHLSRLSSWINFCVRLFLPFLISTLSTSEGRTGQTLLCVPVVFSTDFPFPSAL